MKTMLFMVIAIAGLVSVLIMIGCAVIAYAIAVVQSDENRR